MLRKTSASLARRLGSLRLHDWKTVCATFAIALAASLAASAQTFTVLAQLDGPNGSLPEGLTQGDDGNFYGTTFFGEAHWDGTAFRMTPDGTVTNLFVFCKAGLDTARCENGALPISSPLPAANGHWYGLTQAGGANNENAGTIYEIDSSGKEEVVYSFCSLSGCADGAGPSGNLVQAVDGNIYGVTIGWDIVNLSTIFRLSPAGVLTTIYSGCELGCGEIRGGSLIQGSDGDLYGTSFGGPNGPGTIFKVNPNSGALSILYNFCSLSNCADGAYPIMGLVEGLDGSFYGTTQAGGSTDYGTVFRFSLDGTLTTLHNFCFRNDYPTCEDGWRPEAPLILASDGNLYGTTDLGGTNFCIYVDCGTVFQINRQGQFSTVYDFTPAAFDPSMIIQGTDGLIYGFAGGDIYSLSLGLDPYVETIPSGGTAGETIKIIGQGFTGANSVTINGTAASFTIVSDTLIRSTVPADATTGRVAVTTPTGVLSSNVPFFVAQ
jgi:uncharacterized repeat protein (TIGR03803 family)